MTLGTLLTQVRASRAWPGLLSAAVAAAIALVLIPLYVTAWRVPAVGLFHDDGVYVVTAKALAEGHGYRIISLPDEPPQTKYPPLFPALLAVLWKVGPAFPDNVTLLKLVPLVSALAWFWLSLRLLGRLGLSDVVRPLVIAAVATVPWTVFLATTLLSEMPFAAIATATLLCLESGEEPPNGQRLILAAMLAAAATMTRTTGIALIASGAAWLLFARRDIPRAALFTAIALVLVAPWLTWIASAPDAGYYGASNYRDWNVLSPASELSLATRLRVVALNTIWSAATPGLAFGIAVGPLPIALVTAMLVGGLIRPEVRSRATGWFVVVYVAMVIGWAWPPSRFLYVVMPLLLWVMIAGIPRARYTDAAVACALVALSIAGLVQTTENVRQGARMGALTTGGNGERWQDVLDAATWIRTHTSISDRLVCNLDPMYYLLTGRQATRGFEANPFRLFYDTGGRNPLGTADEAWEAIRRARASVVVETPDLFFAEGPHLKSRYAELEERGLLKPAGSTGPIRFLRAP